MPRPSRIHRFTVHAAATAALVGAACVAGAPSAGADSPLVTRVTVADSGSDLVVLPRPEGQRAVPDRVRTASEMSRAYYAIDYTAEVLTVTYGVARTVQAPGVRQEFTTAIIKRNGGDGPVLVARTGGRQVAVFDGVADRPQFCPTSTVETAPTFVSVQVPFSCLLGVSGGHLQSSADVKYVDGADVAYDYARKTARFFNLAPATVEEPPVEEPPAEEPPAAPEQ